MSIIRLEGITRNFQMGEEVLNVLKGIHLEVEQGEYVALMGPSGSGKSTLMNLIGCLDTPSGGKYYLDGIDVSVMNDNELAEVINTMTLLLRAKTNG